MRKTTNTKSWSWSRDRASILVGCWVFAIVLAVLGFATIVGLITIAEWVF